MPRKKAEPKAIDHDAENRTAHKNRVKAARKVITDERERLRKAVDKIRATCPGSAGHVFRQFGERFVNVGKDLHSTLDPATLWADERLSKRVQNTVMAGCRFKAREARLRAEPVIRAGKAAYTAHREVVKLDQAERKRDQDKKGKTPGVSKMQEKEEAIIREIEAQAGPEFVPIWRKVRVSIYQRVKASSAPITPVEAFAQYLEENETEVQAQLAKINAVNDRALAEQQAAHAKQAARDRGDAVPSSAFAVPAPKSSVRPSQRASQRASQSGPSSMASTVVSGSGPVPVGAVSNVELAEELAAGIRNQESPTRAWRYPNGVEVIQVGRYVAIGFPDGAVLQQEKVPKNANPLTVAAKLAEDYYAQKKAPFSEVPFSVPANDSKRSNSKRAS